MVDILEGVQKICENREKNDLDVFASCIQEIKEEKARGNMRADENEDEDKDSEDGWSQGKLRRTCKTTPERAQWAIKKTQPAHEKHKARLESLKGGLDLLTEILESLTVEECADFKYEEEHHFGMRM